MLFSVDALTKLQTLFVERLQSSNRSNEIQTINVVLTHFNVTWQIIVVATVQAPVQMNHFNLYIYTTNCYCKKLNTRPLSRSPK